MAGIPTISPRKKYPPTYAATGATINANTIMATYANRPEFIPLAYLIDFPLVISDALSAVRPVAKEGCRFFVGINPSFNDLAAASAGTPLPLTFGPETMPASLRHQARKAVMFRTSALLVVLLGLMATAANADFVSDANLAVGDVVLLNKSSVEGWHIVVVPKDEVASLAKATNSSLQLFRITTMGEGAVVLVTVKEQETRFGPKRIERQIPWRSVSEISRFLVADSEEKSDK